MERKKRENWEDKKERDRMSEREKKYRQKKSYRKSKQFSEIENLIKK